MRDLAPRCPWCRAAKAAESRTPTTNHGEMVTRRFACGGQQTLVTMRALMFLRPCEPKEVARAAL